MIGQYTRNIYEIWLVDAGDADDDGDNDHDVNDKSCENTLINSKIQIIRKI